jgi:hypothetical protein
MIQHEIPRVSEVTQGHNSRLGFVLTLVIAISFGLAFLARRILYHTVFQ